MLVTVSSFCSSRSFHLDFKTGRLLQPTRGASHREPGRPPQWRGGPGARSKPWLQQHCLWGRPSSRSRMAAVPAVRARPSLWRPLQPSAQFTFVNGAHRLRSHVNSCWLRARSCTLPPTSLTDPVTAVKPSVLLTSRLPGVSAPALPLCLPVHGPSGSADTLPGRPVRGTQGHDRGILGAALRTATRHSVVLFSLLFFISDSAVTH